MFIMLLLIVNGHHVVVEVHHAMPVANVHCVVVSCWCSLCCRLLVFIALWFLLILFVLKQMRYIVHVHHVLKSVHCSLLKFVMLLLIENAHCVVVEKPLPFVIASRLILRSLTMWPSTHMAIYSKHFVSYYHSLHLKLVQGSWVVEWCFEWNHIHELKAHEPHIVVLYCNTIISCSNI
jgi:hypothetical protein